MSDSSTSACDLLDALQASEEDLQQPFRTSFAFPDAMDSFNFEEASGAVLAGHFAFPGDPYGQNDAEVTRGADPCAFLTSEDGLETPIWTHFGDVMRGGDQLFRDEVPVFGYGKKRSMISQNYPAEFEQEEQNQKWTSTQNEENRAASCFFFDTNATPPKPPTSSLYEMKRTTIYVAAEDAAEVGNQLLDFFRQQKGALNQKATTLLELKGNAEKCTIKATFASSQSLKEVTLKVRMYSFDDDASVVALEFEWKAGKTFEFAALYQQALEFFTTAQPCPAACSREELAFSISSSSSTAPAARADTCAAQAAMTTAVLAPVEEEEKQKEQQQYALESLLQQVSGLNAEASIEAAADLALFAKKLTPQDIATLLVRLMEPRKGEEDYESPLLPPLLSLLEDTVGNGAANYPVACLIEVLFQNPACCEMLWKSPEAARAVFKGIQGPFNSAEDQVSEACLAKLSTTVREICKVLPSVFPVDKHLASEVREQLINYENRPHHDCNSVVQGNLKLAIMQTDLVVR